MKFGQPIRLLELFGGIGACSAAFKRLGIPYVIADYVEIDKYAVKSYNAMHGTHFEPQDITQWDKDIEVDFIMHGSPCQDFSIAGLGAGGDKGSGTRSSLMYETLRIVEKLKPKYVLWENVANILSDKHRHNFDAYWETMETLGYVNQSWKINAKNYGIPQNRIRIYTLSIRSDIMNDHSYFYPCPSSSKHELSDFLEGDYDSKYSVSQDILFAILKNPSKYPKTHIFLKNLQKSILNTDRSNKGFDSTLQIPCEKRCDEGLRFFKDNCFGTLRAMDGCGNKHVLDINIFSSSDMPCIKLRKLTPKECWRLMGFSDEQFELAASVNSDTQLYKQAGNSIVVNVLVAILEELFCK